MNLSRLTSVDAVMKAIRLYDDLGRDEFLSRFHFGEARTYVLVHDGRSYDSKAIAGVAYGIQFPEHGTPTSDDFSGGVASPGAATVLRRLGFVVKDTRGSTKRARSDRPATASVRRAEPAPRLSAATADVYLVGCVKDKRSSAAPARDLYTSDLFRKRRAYAEAAGKPWFILSALHGLTAPDDVLEPYDLALKDQSTSYRSQWGSKVVVDLRARIDLAAGSVVEVHAGASYVEAIETPLRSSGLVVSWPLRGLTLGQQLSWYLNAPAVIREGVVSAPTLADATAWLADPAHAQDPSGFPWGRVDLDTSGLYSWWVDEIGARMLSRGLGHQVSPGLVYAGQAGATSAGRTEAESTLRSRIAGQHLRGGIHASTWRKSLCAVLRDELGLDFEAHRLTNDAQTSLNEWMREHLRLAVYPIADRAVVNAAEAAVLRSLDPPLNLELMDESPVRAALRRLRKELPRRPLR
ncbi:MAG TPA: hypothetical protein VHD81_05335 [Mycobacteriales bacterium]|nr:hypothetical protein [Mycobacteriales bacterium]